MDTILVSVIITVYNKDKYLNETIDSVINQTYDDIEIIIINDGSTDNSESIIEKWLERDKRIIYINQSNHGVAYSRNRGIDTAKGGYLYFLDADDLIEENAIEILIKKSNHHMTDIIVGNYYKIIKNQKKKNISLENRTVTSPELHNLDIKMDMFFYRGRPLASACNKLYKTNFIKKNKIYFIKNVFAEDRLFNLMCYVNDPVITMVNEYLYHYNIIEQSRSRNLPTNFITESLLLIHCLNEHLLKSPKKHQFDTLLEIIAIYDLNNILTYYYKYTKSLKKVNKALNLIKMDQLMNEKIKSARKNKVLNAVQGNKLTFIKYKMLITMYSFLPTSITSFIYYNILKFIEIKKENE